MAKKAQTTNRENTRGKRGKDGRFTEGNEHAFKPGNPGRPKGSRHKLSEAFLSALADDFEAHGKATIERVRKDYPLGYVRVCASILPKELNVSTNPLEDMTDEQLIQRIKQLDRAFADMGYDLLGTDDDDGDVQVH
jgi:hypothetical protein